ncbi:endonuclease/exonuclease/phosphatase family protein [Sphingorhabdus sp.]|jgi:endonuclease/exonuclease/phosphatase family metal-dependent hydrolase|uniref:endonuclease/exonuclease/phosphatase family protein n=1 Tax=Sphingorhabdus sp. TaxID=1902408 RepID=UPI003BB0C0A3|nr:endonuclease/exonuclease/phosphatase family protein [Sphingomonadales bacterium]MBK9432224.1 endonuclease/exonuclease/phosphatase family protein [Sphingomonadales bacterium]
MRILHLLLLTLFAPACVAAKHPQTGTVCEPAMLVMTYNIRLDTPVDGDNGWVHRKSFLTRQIITMRPQILGMQEVLPNQRADLEAALKGYDFVGAGRDDGKNTGEASPLAIERRAFKISSSGTFWLSPTPSVPSLGWDAAYKRVASWAHIIRRSDGAKLLAINTHWDHLGQLARKESGRQILEWIENNRSKNEHLILLGDFNADETEESVVQLSRAKDPQIALVNSRREASNSSDRPMASFNAFNTIPVTGKLIDHIFVNAGVHIQAHAVVAQHENGRVASDHFPVVALLNVPSPRRTSRCGGK